jgi:hypothetical protein
MRHYFEIGDFSGNNPFISNEFLSGVPSRYSISHPVHLSGKMNRSFCRKNAADDYSLNGWFQYKLSVEKNAFLSSKRHT